MTSSPTVERAKEWLDRRFGLPHGCSETDELVSALIAEVEAVTAERDRMREALQEFHEWADGYKNPHTGMGSGLHCEKWPLLNPSGIRVMFEITNRALSPSTPDGGK